MKTIWTSRWPGCVITTSTTNRPGGYEAGCSLHRLNHGCGCPARGGLVGYRQTIASAAFLSRADPAAQSADASSPARMMKVLFGRHEMPGRMKRAETVPEERLIRLRLITSGRAKRSAVPTGRGRLSCQFPGISCLAIVWFLPPPFHHSIRNQAAS